MKIFIACSKWNYKYIPYVKNKLERLGHSVILPNYYDDPMIEERIRNISIEEHQKFYVDSFKMSQQKSAESDCILVLNMDKITSDGIKYDYIGGSTLLEMYDSYLLNHPIYLYNEIPFNSFRDEIIGMQPIVINGDLKKIGEINARSFSRKKI